LRFEKQIPLNLLRVAGNQSYNAGMSVDIAYPHIVKSASEPARLVRLPRLRVAQIAADYIARGWSAEEMCRQHPDLRLSEAHSAMAYYFDHQQEIDAELQAELDQSESARDAAMPTRLQLRLRALGQL
jgi:uncharacterized protein (DUF433 family)